VKFGVALLAFIVLAFHAAPAHADLLQTLTDVNIGTTPAALAGINARGLILSRALFAIIFATALVAAVVSHLIETRSLESVGVAFVRVLKWCLLPLAMVSAVWALLPNVGAFFQGIAGALGVQIVSPAGLLTTGLHIAIGMIAIGAAVGGSPVGLPFSFGPAAVTDAMAWVCAAIVVFSFVAIAAKILVEIWGLALFCAIGSWRVALFGSTQTEAQGWAFVFDILGKGGTIITLLVVAALITTEASSWPAYLLASNIGNFVEHGLVVSGGAIFCMILTWGIAKECGIAFAAGAASGLARMAITKIP
jgi:hypothetical protein